MGFEWFWQLFIPVILSAIVARALLWACGEGLVGTVLAAGAATVCFILILRRQPLISAQDADELASLSPRLVRLLRLISTTSRK
jgi:hypothetical protein